MKHLEEYRDAKLVRALAEQIGETQTRPWSLMEICGGQTHSIVKHGLAQLLPSELRLIHGPGCPVCVTPIELIDVAIALSLQPDVTLCSFGDMLRVPGSSSSLLRARGQGAQTRIVYSPLEAVTFAEEHPERQVVLFAVGFETTAPATAMAVRAAHSRGLTNFSLLVSHVLVPPALSAMLQDEEHQIDGLLAAGHVCSVMGMQQYDPVADRFSVPIVVTGFEPVDILDGILRCVRQLESGQARVENQYARSVRPEGNLAARAGVEAVFQVTDRAWRGLGSIPESGLSLRPEWAQFDALRRFALSVPKATEPGDCIAGLVLQGKRRPSDCPAFGTRCSPEHPIGAPMVSSEGACAAYFRFRHRAGAERNSVAGG